MEKSFQAGWYYNERTDMKERLYLNCYTPVNIDKWFVDNRNECDDRMAEVRQACNINQWLLFYLGMLDKAKNIPNRMKERMKRGLAMMYRKPFFRIDELRSECDVTHSTATKMVNLFIALKLVKQVNDKQRYRVYEYIPLIECIQRI